MEPKRDSKQAGPYPNGMDWECMECGFKCGDEGPDRCPRDGAPLTRLIGTFMRAPWAAT